MHSNTQEHSPDRFPSNSELGGCILTQQVPIPAAKHGARVLGRIVDWSTVHLSPLVAIRAGRRFLRLSLLCLLSQYGHQLRSRASSAACEFQHPTSNTASENGSEVRDARDLDLLNEPSEPRVDFIFPRSPLRKTLLRFQTLSARCMPRLLRL
ncbi:hypothetical protein VTK56DRAFT_9000 [Thermocarpiscus australiensis]